MIWLDAVEQAQSIRRREATSVDLVREYIDRIDRLDPALHSYVTVDASGALEAAEEADMRIAQEPTDVGPLHGVAISVKDVIDVAGLPTTHSSKAFADNVRSADDPLVRRFRQAGLVVIGKTNIPEFCTSMTSSDLNGICCNPWDPERTPGGSSGGAAAALAAGLCSIAHGTDGAGSTRVPAAFCGLVGLKPTRGLVSFGPEEGKAYFGTSEPGVIARSVRDAAALLDVMVGTGDPLSAWSPRPTDSYLEQAVALCGQLRIAVTTSPPFGSVESECADAAVRVGALLESLGHHVVSGTPDWGVILQAALIPAEVPGAAGLVSPEHYELLELRNRPIAQRLAGLTVAEHAANGGSDAEVIGRVPHLLGGRGRPGFADCGHAPPFRVVGTMGADNGRAHGDLWHVSQLRPAVQPVRPACTEPSTRLEQLRAPDRRTARGSSAQRSRSPAAGRSVGGSTAVVVPPSASPHRGRLR